MLASNTWNAAGLAFLGQFLDHDERVHQRGARAAESLRQADPEQPERAEVAPLLVRERRALRVPGRRQRRVPLARDVGRDRRELPGVVVKGYPQSQPPASQYDDISMHHLLARQRPERGSWC